MFGADEGKVIWDHPKASPLCSPSKYKLVSLEQNLQIQAVLSSRIFSNYSYWFFVFVHSLVSDKTIVETDRKEKELPWGVRANKSKLKYLYISIAPPGVSSYVRKLPLNSEGLQCWWSVIPEVIRPGRSVTVGLREVQVKQPDEEVMSVYVRTGSSVAAGSFQPSLQFVLCLVTALRKTREHSV